MRRYLGKSKIFVLPAVFLLVLLYSMIFESKNLHLFRKNARRYSGNVVDRWNAQMEYAYYLERNGKTDKAIEEYKKVSTRFRYPAVQDGYLSDLAYWHAQQLSNNKKQQKDFDWTLYYDN